MQNFS